MSYGFYSGIAINDDVSTPWIIFDSTATPVVCTDVVELNNLRFSVVEDGKDGSNEDKSGSIVELLSVSISADIFSTPWLLDSEVFWLVSVWLNGLKFENVGNELLVVTIPLSNFLFASVLKVGNELMRSEIEGGDNVAGEKLLKLFNVEKLGFSGLTSGFKLTPFVLSEGKIGRWGDVVVNEKLGSWFKFDRVVVDATDNDGMKGRVNLVLEGFIVLLGISSDSLELSLYEKYSSI